MVKNNYAIYSLALLYAVFFVYLMPWVEFIGREFADIPNYLERIIYLRAGGDEAEFWGISWLQSEPLWKEIIIFLGPTFERGSEGAPAGQALVGGGGGVEAADQTT